MRPSWTTATDALGTPVAERTSSTLSPMRATTAAGNSCATAAPAHARTSSVDASDRFKPVMKPPVHVTPDSRLSPKDTMTAVLRISDAIVLGDHEIEER